MAGTAAVVAADAVVMVAVAAGDVADAAAVVAATVETAR
jgi:hypothetical protein